MTTGNSLKRRIRARMEETGERYTTARRAVLGDGTPPVRGTVDGYDHVGGGAHHDSALASNLLRQAGVVNPLTGEPFSEPMLAGLAGGIGIMYFLFEYQGHLPMLTLLLRHHPDDFVEGMLDRLGVDHVVHHTGSARKAESALRATIDEGRGALVRVTRGALPYQDREPISGDHYEVGIAGVDGDDVLVDDERSTLWRIPMDELTAARAYTKKDRFRMIEVTGTGTGDLAAGIRAAIGKTCHNLTEPVMGNNFDANFGFRGLAKLRHELTSGGKAGWVKRFPDPAAQFTNLHRLVAGIEHEWGSSGGMRPLYGEFLDEAGSLLDSPGLSDLASEFFDAGERWSDLAAEALSPRVPGMGELRNAMDDVSAASMVETSHPFMGSGPVDDLRSSFVAGGGLDATEATALYGSMAARIDRILEVEQPAVEALRSVGRNM